METPKQLFDTRVNVSLGDTASPSSTAFVTKPPTWSPRMIPPPRPTEIRADRHRQPSSPRAVLKPTAGGIRRVPPVGSPKGEGRHDQASRRSTGGVASSQVDPTQGGTGAQRHGRWRDRSPLRFPERMDGAAPLAFIQPPAAPREVRLIGFPGALAVVLRHCVGGAGRRVADAAPTGGSAVRFVVEPAYSLGPHSVSPLRRLAGGCAPSDPRTGNGAP